MRGDGELDHLFRECVEETTVVYLCRVCVCRWMKEAEYNVQKNCLATVKNKKI